MKKKISAAVAFCSFMWILGLAGSVELNRIGFAELVAQGIPALALLCLSFWKGGLTE